jgi:hypothetical protein
MSIIKSAKYVFNSMPFSLAAPKHPKKDTIVTKHPIVIAPAAIVPERLIISSFPPFATTYEPPAIRRIPAS